MMNKPSLKVIGLFSIVVIIVFGLIFVSSNKQSRDLTLKEIIQIESQNSIQKKPAVQEVNSEVKSDEVYDEKVMTSYYIIIGSYNNIINAQKAADEIVNDSNINIIILPLTKEGYTRISYGKYATREAAESEIKNVKDTINPNAWILEDK